MARRALFVGLTVLFFAAPGLAQDRSVLIEQGQQLFFTHGCYGCHTVGTMGPPIGPDLSHVGAHYPLTWAAFVLDNLVPVALGNLVGGGGMVAAV